MEKFEKEKEADAKCIADLECALPIQVGLHRFEVEGLEKKLDEITKNFNEIFAIRQNEEESHTALEEARKAKEATERERLIGVFGALDVIRIANEATLYMKTLRETVKMIKIFRVLVGPPVRSTARVHIEFGRSTVTPGDLEEEVVGFGFPKFKEPCSEWLEMTETMLHRVMTEDMFMQQYDEDRRNEIIDSLKEKDELLSK
ncbi:hypothetical protein ACJX0J_024945 [Zea mays]